MQGTSLVPLIEAQEQVVKAGELWAAGEDLAALNLLIEAKMRLRQAVVSIIGECLKQKLSANRWSDQKTFDRDLRDLDDLLRLVAR